MNDSFNSNQEQGRDITPKFAYVYIKDSEFGMEYRHILNSRSINNEDKYYYFLSAKDLRDSIQNFNREAVDRYDDYEIDFGNDIQQITFIGESSEADDFFDYMKNKNVDDLMTLPFSYQDPAFLIEQTKGTKVFDAADSISVMAASNAKRDEEDFSIMNSNSTQSSWNLQTLWEGIKAICNQIIEFFTKLLSQEEAEESTYVERYYSFNSTYQSNHGF